MIDSTAPRARMTHGYLRRFGVIGGRDRSGPGPPGPLRTADTPGINFALLPPPGLVPCVPAHAAAKPTI